MDQSLSSRGDWERLYVEYVDVERARGRKPTTFDAFRRMVSELARGVLATHGCRMVDIAIVEQDGRPHMKIDPVFDADVE